MAAAQAADEITAFIIWINTETERKKTDKKETEEIERRNYLLVHLKLTFEMDK